MSAICMIIIPYQKYSSMLKYRVAKQSNKRYVTEATVAEVKSVEPESSYLERHSRRIAETRKTRSANNAKGVRLLKLLSGI